MRFTILALIVCALTACGGGGGGGGSSGGGTTPPPPAGPTAKNYTGTKTFSIGTMAGETDTTATIHFEVTPNTIDINTVTEGTLYFVLPNGTTTVSGRNYNIIYDSSTDNVTIQRNGSSSNSATWHLVPLSAGG